MANYYKNPPLVEALCEFRFDENIPWDVTVLGNYYNRILKEFPEKKQLQQVEMSLRSHKGGVTGGIRETGVRMQFIRTDHSAMVQLSPHRLIVNKLAPYESWAIFKELVFNRLYDYWTVVGDAPLQQIGLRYINHFEFPIEGFTIEASYGPSAIFPPLLRGVGAPFFMRLERSQNKEGRLLVTMGTTETEKPDKVSVLLDIDYQIVGVEKLDQVEMSKYLDKAHDCIEEVFESCLTDELRYQFGWEGVSS